MTLSASVRDAASAKRAELLAAAIAACQSSPASSRSLDAEIARAIFAGLADLAVIEQGVWQHGDGSRVRALHYSSQERAAATLVPMGGWMERAGRAAIVHTADGHWAGDHAVEPIALCIAALSARLSQYSIGLGRGSLSGDWHE